jgi:hypothetical protein
MNWGGGDTNIQSITCCKPAKHDNTRYWRKVGNKNYFYSLVRMCYSLVTTTLQHITGKVEDSPVKTPHFYSWGGMGVYVCMYVCMYVCILSQRSVFMCPRNHYKNAYHSINHNIQSLKSTQMSISSILTKLWYSPTIYIN